MVGRLVSVWLQAEEVGDEIVGVLGECGGIEGFFLCWWGEDGVAGTVAFAVHAELGLAFSFLGFSFRS